MRQPKIAKAVNGETNALSVTVSLFTEWLLKMPGEHLLEVIKEAEGRYLEEYEKFTKPLGEPTPLYLLSDEKWETASTSEKGLHFFGRIRNAAALGSTKISESIFTNRVAILKEEMSKVGGLKKETVIAYLKSDAFQLSGDGQNKFSMRYSLKHQCFGLLFTKFLEESRVTSNSADENMQCLSMIVDSYKLGKFDPFKKAADIYNMFIGAYGTIKSIVRKTVGSGAESFGNTAADFFRLAHMDQDQEQEQDQKQEQRQEQSQNRNEVESMEPIPQSVAKNKAGFHARGKQNSRFVNSASNNDHAVTGSKAKAVRMGHGSGSDSD